MSLQVTWSSSCHAYITALPFVTSRYLDWPVSHLVDALVTERVSMFALHNLLRCGKRFIAQSLALRCDTITWREATLRCVKSRCIASRHVACHG